MRTTKILATVFVLAPAASSADMAFTDMYVGGFGGAVFGVDAEGKNDTVFPGGTATVDFDPDGEYALGLVFGARVAQNFRAEVELSYSNSDIDGTKFTAGGPGIDIVAKGDLSSTSLLLNGWYEFETNSSWRPYLGGGIGYTNVDADVFSTAAIDAFKDSDGGFSYQIGFGATFPVGQSGTVDIGYRYHETPGLKLNSEANSGFAFDDIDFKTQTIQVGYNYRF